MKLYKLANMNWCMGLLTSVISTAHVIIDDVNEYLLKIMCAKLQMVQHE